MKRLNSLVCILGPSLPFDLMSSAMAESPDHKGVLIFGGWSFNGKTTRPKQTSILELRAGANAWTILDIKLKDERQQHTVIPLQ